MNLIVITFPINPSNPRLHAWWRGYFPFRKWSVTSQFFSVPLGTLAKWWNHIRLQAARIEPANLVGIGSGRVWIGGEIDYLFSFVCTQTVFLLLRCVWFSSSFRMVKMLKLEIYSNQWVMLGCKRSSRSPTGTVRLGFWFGLGDPHNRSLNLKSRKENREKKIWPSILLIRLNDVRVRRVHLRKVGKLGWRRPFTKGTTATTWEK